VTAQSLRQRERKEKMAKKKGIQSYLARYPQETVQSVKYFLLNTCHQDWHTGLCVGRTKTWRRLKLYKPQLARYISKTEMYHLMDMGNGWGCGVPLRCRAFHLLSPEQQARAQQGHHVLASSHADPGALRTSSRFIVLDRSRATRKNGEAETDQFWVAVIVHRPVRFDGAAAAAAAAAAPRRRRRLILPFHTKSLSNVLQWSGLLHFLQNQSQSNILWDCFVDQSWDFQKADWETCCSTLSRLNHRLTSHCLGLKRQAVQWEAEQTIAMTRRFKCRELQQEQDRNQAAQLLTQRHLGEAHWSMSRILFQRIQGVISTLD
jgi:hypothetical protein